MVDLHVSLINKLIGRCSYWLGIAGAQAIHDHPMSNRENPGAQPRRLTQAGQGPQYPQPDVLHQVISLGRLVGKAPDITTQAVGVALNQFIKSITLPKLAADRQQLIRRVGGRSFRVFVHKLVSTGI